MAANSSKNFAYEFDKGGTALHDWLALLNSDTCHTPALDRKSVV